MEKVEGTDKKDKEEIVEKEPKAKKKIKKSKKSDSTPVLEYLIKAGELAVTIFIIHRFYHTYFGYKSEKQALSFDEFTR